MVPPCIRPPTVFNSEERRDYRIMGEKRQGGNLEKLQYAATMCEIGTEKQNENGVSPQCSCLQLIVEERFARCITFRQEKEACIR